MNISDYDNNFSRKYLINFFKRFACLAAILICSPLIGTIFIKPDRELWEESGCQKIKDDTDVINTSFRVKVRTDIGSFTYTPEGVLPYVVNAVVYSNADNEYIQAGFNAEYLRTMAIVCRSNLVYAWENSGCPEILEISEKSGISEISGISNKALSISASNPSIDNKEVRSAVEDTKGFILIYKDEVAAAPFFYLSTGKTKAVLGCPYLISKSCREDMVSPDYPVYAVEGYGLSQNYALYLADSGWEYSDILTYFFDGVEIGRLYKQY